jgi:photosystem II stability/assembly factor-like uncharacterized protein
MAPKLALGHHQKIRTMRSLLLILSSIIIFSAHAQNWTEQTSNTTAELVAIHFYNPSTGVAVGGGGTVVSTADGGDTWILSSAGAEYDMLSAEFTGDIIYAGGEMATTGDGFIIKSDDRGQNWTPQTTNLPERILGISFPSESHGWAAGRKGLLLKTIDGGLNWTNGNSPTPEDITAVYFWDANTGWIADEDGFIYHTTNGGTSWTTQSTGVDKDLYDIQFVSASEGFAGGKNANLLHTANGGTNWAAQAATQEDVMAIHMLTNNNIRVAATGGEILHTTDGGTNSANTGDAVFVELSDIFMIHDSLGWVCSETGVIAKLTNDTSGSGGLAASFTAPLNVCQHEEVTFTDNSQGDIEEWTWNFDDGSAVVAAQNPQHTFTQNGTYNVTLTIQDAQGNTDQYQQIINVYPEVTAAFSMSLDTINLTTGNSVMLTNESANSILHDWDFGNGNTSAFEHPTAVYNTPGTYTIRLVASNDGCTDTAEAQVVVIGSTSGIQGTTATSLEVYPNPATDYITVISEHNIGKVLLMNILGEVLLAQDPGTVNRKQLDLRPYPTGVYLLTVFVQGEKITKHVKISR